MTESNDFSYALWQLVIHTSYTMKRARQRELLQFGITFRNSAVLSTIIRLGDEATLSNIAQQLILEKNSMSAQLTRMEKEGIIKKVKDPKKKNLMSITLTNKGHELYVKGLERNAINSVMSTLTEDEKQALWAILAKLRDKSMIELGKESVNLYPPSEPVKLTLTAQREGV